MRRLNSIDNEVTDAYVKEEISKEEIISQAKKAEDSTKANEGIIFYDDLGKDIFKPSTQKRPVFIINKNGAKEVYNFGFSKNIVTNDEKNEFLNFYFQNYASAIKQAESPRRISFYKELNVYMNKHVNNYGSIFGRMKMHSVLDLNGLPKRSFMDKIHEKIDYWKDFHKSRESKSLTIISLTTLLIIFLSYINLNSYVEIAKQILPYRELQLLILSLIFLLPIGFLHVFWEAEDIKRYEDRTSKYFSKLQEKHLLEDIPFINTIEYVYYLHKRDDNAEFNNELLKGLYDNYEFVNIGSQNGSLELVRQSNLNFKDFMHKDLSKLFSFAKSLDRKYS